MQNETKGLTPFSPFEGTVKNEHLNNDWDYLTSDVPEELKKLIEFDVSSAYCTSDNKNSDGCESASVVVKNELKIEVIDDESPGICEVKSNLRKRVDGRITGCNEKKFRCYHCKSSYIHKGDLQRHVGSKHLNLKPYRCFYCNYAGARKNSLARHIIINHMEAKLFGCELCPYRAGSKYHLKRHVNTIHSNSRNPKNNYNCAYCNFRSKHKESIRKHVSRRHGTLFNSKHFKIEKPLTSDQGSINKPSESPKRILREKIHKCSYCDFCTKTPSRIEDHINAVHHNVKPYECQLCSFSTSYRESLKRHHTENHTKKSKCTFCPLSFDSKPLLNYHIDTIHMSSFGLVSNMCFCIYCFEAYYCKDNLQRHIKLRHRKKF